ncbi:MAG: hypothetical protein GKR98_00335 [Boseongicola sp.]|nr:MAG: hypothetical protein GKR98_00335 [Boseongicola sp.]
MSTGNANPEFSGNCALAASIKKGATDGVPVGKPDVAVEMGGKTYLFSNGVARMIWRLTYAPSGKLMRWVVLLAVVAGLLWLVRRLLA